MRRLLQIISTSRALFIFKGFVGILVSVVHSHLSTDGERGQGHFTMFANRAGKGSGGLVRFVLGVEGLFSLLAESQVGFCAACQLGGSARQDGELAQQRWAVSINLGLHSNLKGRI